MFNIVRLTSLIVAAQCLVACSNPEEPAAETVDQQAQRLAQTSIIVDTHDDVP